MFSCGKSGEKEKYQVSSGDVDGFVMVVTSDLVSITEEELLSTGRSSSARRSQ